MIAPFVLYVSMASASQQIPQAQETAPIKQQDKTDNKTQPRSEPQQPAPPTRVTINEPVTVINQPDPKQEQRDAEQRTQTKLSNYFQFGTLVFAAIAAAGAVGAYFANKRSADAAEAQAILLKGQIADARVDAAEQRRIAIDGLAETCRVANAMKESADAAKTSAQVAQQALVISHRAQLHIIKFAIEWGQPNPRVYVVLNNSGRLPALIHGWAADYVPGPLPTVRNMATLVHHGNAGPVGPGEDATLEATIPLSWTNKEWTELRHGIRRMNIWGVVNYHTGFVDVPGETGFGFDYIPSATHPSYGERFAATDASGYNYST
jgi:hypothetical protein